jgi:hypothetical protein
MLKEVTTSLFLSFSSPEPILEENLQKPSDIKIISEMFSTEIIKIIDVKFIHYWNWNNLYLDNSFRNCSLKSKFNWSIYWSNYEWSELDCWFDDLKIRLLDIITNSWVFVNWDECIDRTYYRSFQDWIYDRLNEAYFQKWWDSYPDIYCSYFDNDIK